MKNIRLPNKVRDSFFDQGTIFYSVGRGDSEKNEREIRLPLWLTDLINQQKQNSYWEGWKAHQNELKQLLGLK